jgi:hypothetical protein
MTSSSPPLCVVGCEALVGFVLPRERRARPETSPKPRIGRRLRAARRQAVPWRPRAPCRASQAIGDLLAIGTVEIKKFDERDIAIRISSRAIGVAKDFVSSQFKGRFALPSPPNHGGAREGPVRSRSQIRDADLFPSARDLSRHPVAGRHASRGSRLFCVTTVSIVCTIKALVPIRAEDGLDPPYLHGR